MKANSESENITEVELWMGTGYLEGWRGEAQTLLPIIAQYVRPGTVVYSDEWSAYNQLATTTHNVHHTVNHSLHFVDPVTGAHTLRECGALAKE